MVTGKGPGRVGACSRRRGRAGGSERQGGQGVAGRLVPDAFEQPPGLGQFGIDGQGFARGGLGLGQAMLFVVDPGDVAQQMVVVVAEFPGLEIVFEGLVEQSLFAQVDAELVEQVLVLGFEGLFQGDQAV